MKKIRSNHGFTIFEIIVILLFFAVIASVVIGIITHNYVPLKILGITFGAIVLFLIVIFLWPYKK